jgi:integrase
VSDEKTPKAEVSPGSVTKYLTKKGARWRWQGYATIIDGSSKKGSHRLGEAGFTTKKEAQAAMLDAFYEIRKFGLPSGPQNQPDLLSFNSLSSLWLDSLDLANSTLAGYRKIIRNHISPYLGNKIVDELTTEDLNKLYKRLLSVGRNDSKAPGGPLKSNTVHKCHQVLRSMLDFAVVQELIPENVARSPKVTMPSARSIKSEKEELEVWTLGQTKNFLRWNEEVYCDDLNVLWRVFAMTGLRRGEGIALQWRDIDFEKSRIKVIRASDSAKAKATKRTKTYRQRSLEIDPELLGYLDRHRRESPYGR